MSDYDKITTKRDTWRALKGLEPVQTWKCRLGVHQWTNWEIWEDRYDVGLPGHAQCYCARCGMPRVELPVSKTKRQ